MLQRLQYEGSNYILITISINYYYYYDFSVFHLISFFIEQKENESESSVSAQLLPPTEAATKLHCRRVYFQIMAWIEKEGGLATLKWGWNNQYIPVMTTRNSGLEKTVLVLASHSLSDSWIVPRLRVAVQRCLVEFISFI